MKANKQFTLFISFLFLINLPKFTNFMLISNDILNKLLLRGEL
jgi:hypothetical protein